MAIWNILRTFGKFYGHLVHFVFIWYIYSVFGIVHQEKSGNPVLDPIVKEGEKQVVRFNKNKRKKKEKKQVVLKRSPND
jgi:hypothetical protein